MLEIIPYMLFHPLFSDPTRTCCLCPFIHVET